MYTKQQKASLYLAPLPGALTWPTTLLWSLSWMPKAKSLSLKVEFNPQPWPECKSLSRSPNEKPEALVTLAQGLQTLTLGLKSKSIFLI